MDKIQNLYIHIGNQIRNQREEKKLTQTRLASTVNLKRTSITNIEAGTQKIQIHTLYEIAEVLGCHITDLLPINTVSYNTQDQLELPDLNEKEKQWLEKVIGREGKIDGNE